MPIDVIMPKVDMVMESGTIARWHKAEGEAVRAGEPIFDLETDKATMEVEAPASGTLMRITAPNGATVPVATVIALILEQGERLELPSAPAAPADPRPRATPLARKIAREHGLSLAGVAGAGPNGRIRGDDVLRLVRARAPESAPAPPPRPNGTEPAPQPNSQPTIPAPLPNSQMAATAPDAGKLVPLTAVRKIVAQRLAASTAIPQFSISIDADLSAAHDLRERLPYRPSITAILARVVAATLPRHPLLNASFRDDGIWQHAPVHLGIALDSGGDLLVPVIRDAQVRTLADIATALAGIRQRAEAKKLAPGELQGSTFSISNLGMLGVEQFVALVNPPEAAILAVGRAVRRPFEADGAIVFRPMLTLTLSADHRVSDGATAARFLNDVRAALENPLLLI